MIDKNNHGSGICPYETNAHGVGETSCGNFVHMVTIGTTGWKYCPWCGRTIFYVQQREHNNE